jgi:hypothetical protein
LGLLVILHNASDPQLFFRPTGLLLPIQTVLKRLVARKWKGDTRSAIFRNELCLDGAGKSDDRYHQDDGALPAAGPLGQRKSM